MAWHGMSEHGGLVFFSFLFFSFSSDQQHYFQRALQHRIALASAFLLFYFFGASFRTFHLFRIGFSDPWMAF